MSISRFYSCLHVYLIVIYFFCSKAPTAEKSQGSAEGTPKRKRRRSGVDSPSVTGGDDSQSATPENGNKVKRRRSSSGSGDVTTEDAIASKSPKRVMRIIVCLLTARKHSTYLVVFMH